ncbi:MAG: hypothetical protein CMQ24_04140 [Gammaproteobacteria bacterium]|nr:hypothetical protein [Gammaproteobacteria bacterium]
MTTESNLIYGDAGGRPLHADLYRPDQANGAGVLMIHGGGWRQGNKEIVRRQATALVGHGFTCLACEYRLTGESTWPAQIHDVKAAMRWFRNEAGALGLDVARLGALGNSAGGHLALTLAGTVGLADYEGESGTPGVDTSVGAVIAVYPAVKFHVGERTSGANNAEAILGKNPDPAEAERAGPINHVTGDFPPTCFVHGNGDKVVPPSASLNFYNALVQAGATAELHMYAETPHAWARWPNWIEPTMSQAGVFLRRYLVGEEQWGEPAPGWG